MEGVVFGEQDEEPLAPMFVFALISLVTGKRLYIFLVFPFKMKKKIKLHNCSQ